MGRTLHLPWGCIQSNEIQDGCNNTSSPHGDASFGSLRSQPQSTKLRVNKFGVTFLECVRQDAFRRGTARSRSRLFSRHENEGRADDTLRHLRRRSTSPAAVTYTNTEGPAPAHYAPPVERPSRTCYELRLSVALSPRSQVIPLFTSACLLSTLIWT